MKPAFAVIGAWLFSESMQQKGMPARIIATLLMVVIVAGLLLQPDIGQTALMLATWAALLFLVGHLVVDHRRRWRAAASALLFGAYVFFPHFAKRIDTFLNPEDGNTYQIDKALYVAARGRLVRARPGRVDRQEAHPRRPCRLCVLGRGGRVRHPVLPRASWR